MEKNKSMSLLFIACTNLMTTAGEIQEVTTNVVKDKFNLALTMDTREEELEEIEDDLLFDELLEDLAKLQALKNVLLKRNHVEL
jgi:hypothetical protein